jgi:hypothetical protein
MPQRPHDISPEPFPPISSAELSREVHYVSSNLRLHLKVRLKHLGPFLAGGGVVVILTVLQHHF